MRPRCLDRSAICGTEGPKFKSGQPDRQIPRLNRPLSLLEFLGGQREFAQAANRLCVVRNGVLELLVQPFCENLVEAGNRCP